MYLWLFVLKLHQKPKSILRKYYRFFLNFDFVFPCAFGNLEILNFDLFNVPTRFTFLSNKILLEKIEVIIPFQLEIN